MKTLGCRRLIDGLEQLACVGPDRRARLLLACRDDGGGARRGRLFSPRAPAALAACVPAGALAAASQRCGARAPQQRHHAADQASGAAGAGSGGCRSAGAAHDRRRSHTPRHARGRRGGTGRRLSGSCSARGEILLHRSSPAAADAACRRSARIKNWSAPDDIGIAALNARYGPGRPARALPWLPRAPLDPAQGLLDRVERKPRDEELHEFNRLLRGHDRVTSSTSPTT